MTFQSFANGLAITLLVLLACTTSSEAKPQPKKSPAKASAQIPKKQWLKWFTEDFSKDMCEAKGYVDTCYAIGKKNCIKTFEQSVNTCWGRESVLWQQKTVHPQEEGIVMGYRLGLCAGSDVQRKLHKSKKSESKCANMVKWMGR